MKRLIGILILGLSLFTIGFSRPAEASDLGSGAKVFSANCAACHVGGGNLVNAAKTLKQSDLTKYEMASLTAIQTQVKNGKNAMPAFGGRLSDAQIEDVATYVLDQADKW